MKNPKFLRKMHPPAIKRKQIKQIDRKSKNSMEINYNSSKLSE
jgi:hypothetical protein